VRGSFQDQFLVHLREGEPCGRCGGPIVKMVVGGRGTYVCETCQPRPRRSARGRARRAQAAG
jgi:formamidopyrimidine-DNA glycosylase